MNRIVILTVALFVLVILNNGCASFLAPLDTTTHTVTKMNDSPCPNGTTWSNIQNVCVAVPVCEAERLANSMPNSQAFEDLWGRTNGGDKVISFGDGSAAACGILQESWNGEYTNRYNDGKIDYSCRQNATSCRDKQGKYEIRVAYYRGLGSIYFCTTCYCL